MGPEPGPRGLRAVPSGRPHEIVPQPGTVYSVGPRNAGNPASLGNPLHHPVEAVCWCGLRIVRDAAAGAGSAWRHEEREPLG